MVLLASAQKVEKKTQFEVTKVKPTWMLLTWTAMTDKTSTVMRLNSSKQPQAPVWARPWKEKGNVYKWRHIISKWIAKTFRLILNRIIYLLYHKSSRSALIHNQKMKTLKVENIENCKNARMATISEFEFAKREF